MNIIANFYKGEKLNEDNYNIWHLNMHYVLNKQEDLEVLNQANEEMQLARGQNPNNAQHKHDMNVYHG